MATNDEVSKERKRIPGCYFKIPVNVLSSETKDKLKFLDCNFFLPDGEVNLRDYRGLAVLVGYTTMELNYLIDQKRCCSPTFLILERMKTDKKSVGDLIEYLLKLKRIDILANIEDLVNKDVKNLINKSEVGRQPKIDYEILQQIASKTEVEEANKELGKLFTTDIIATTNQKIDIYDVFISFDSESVFDINVMWQLSSCLEDNEMSVAKGSYSFFQGCCLIEAFANAIYNRSKKVVLLISTSYIKSESCLMQLNFARDADKASWRNKVIPVYIENVKKPECIANINSFNYYNEFIREKFLDTFIKSVKHS